MQPKGKPAQTDAKLKKLNFFCVWVLTNAIGLCIIVKLNQFTPFATVAQQVEQLTRNEQVVRSNRISSSNKSPESIRIPGFCYFSLQFFFKYPRRITENKASEGADKLLTGPFSRAAGLRTQIGTGIRFYPNIFCSQ